jgi:hypothetical protein
MPALFPVDPAGGGTWVGVNAAGLTAALLNRTVAGGPERGAPLSRGLVLPRLLGEESLSGAVRILDALAAGHFRPFRLLVVHRNRALVASSDGGALSSAHFTLVRPMLLTSSSLGDALVREPRRRLFEQMILAVPAEQRLEAQARFHEHQWPAHTAASVSMERPDARTVSRTVVGVNGGNVSLRYSPALVFETIEESAA